MIRADLTYEDLAGPHAVATLSEVAAIADVRPEIIRRDVNRRIIKSAVKNGVGFYAADIFCLAAMYRARSKLLATPAVRKIIFSAYRDRLLKTENEFHLFYITSHEPKRFRVVLDALVHHHIVNPVRTASGIEEWLLSVDDFTLNIKRTCEFVESRADLYYEGLKRT